MALAGYVYIVHAHGTRYVKVGKTTNIGKRLKDLQRGVPFELRILTVRLVYDMDAEEKSLLEKYEAYRTRGEWFELPETLLLEWPVEDVAREAADPTSWQQICSAGGQALQVFRERKTVWATQLAEALELTSPRGKNYVRQILFTLERAKTIRRVGRGVYEFIEEKEHSGAQVFS